MISSGCFFVSRAVTREVQGSFDFREAAPIKPLNEIFFLAEP